MPSLARAEAAARTFEHLIWHDAHGYSQIHRAGNGTIEHVRIADDEVVRIHGGDIDCSEGVRMALAAVGILEWDYWESYMWTGNEIRMLKAHGFVQVPLHAVRRGDVLWRTGHTGMYLGEGWQGEALRSETHGIDGVVGDQDGREVCRNPYNQYEWESAWRYVEPEPKPEPDQRTTGQTEEEMICLIQPDGGGTMYYVDGTSAHALANPKEADAIREVYRKTHAGKEIPTFALGTKKDPVAAHLFAVLKRN